MKSRVTYPAERRCLAVWVWVCVCVCVTCVCVCVNHLKRGKLLTCGFVIVTCFFFGGVFLKKQGATGSLHGCRQWSPMLLTRIWSLINSTYLRPVFVSLWWAAANPRTTSPFFNQFQLFQPIWCHFCACTVFAICTLSKPMVKLHWLWRW